MFIATLYIDIEISMSIDFYYSRGYIETVCQGRQWATGEYRKWVLPVYITPAAADTECKITQLTLCVKFTIKYIFF